MTAKKHQVRFVDHSSQKFIGFKSASLVVLVCSYVWLTKGKGGGGCDPCASMLDPPMRAVVFHTLIYLGGHWWRSG